MADGADLGPPDAVLVNRRWVQQDTADYAVAANRIMLEHGAVSGQHVYEKRHQARWRAKKVMDLMIELRLHERWELREHTTKHSGGWTWTVEYVGRQPNG